MRSRFTTLPLLLSLLATALLCGAALLPTAGAQPAAGKSAKLSRQQLLQILTEEIDLSQLQSPLKLATFLNWLRDKIEAKRGVKVPIIVNETAFRAENPDAPPVLETSVKLPALTPRLSVGEALGMVLDQMPTGNASFLIRQGKLDITTDFRADPQSLLQEKVFAVFKGRRFVDALEELSGQTGLSIVIDPRIGEKANIPVSATFVNNSSLEAAIVILTNMVGVEPILLRDVVYITTPENAHKLRAIQQKLQSAPKKYRTKDMMEGPMIPGLPGA